MKLSKDCSGLLADSLPDKFGTTLINNWLQRQGRASDSLDPVERLCYTGNRGMGALEYEPSIYGPDKASTAVDVDEMVNLVKNLMQQKLTFRSVLLITMLFIRF